MNASLQSLGNALIYGLGANHHDRIALAYSLTSAENAARLVSADPSSLPYFEAMSTRLLAVGWEQWWSSQVNNTTLIATDADAAATLGWNSSDLSSLSMASPRCIQQSWQSLVTAVAESPEAQALLDAWWPRTQLTASVRQMRIGPFVNLAGTPVLLLGVLSIGGTLDSWRQLFQPGSVQYAGHALGLSLDRAAYAAHAAGLETSLKDEVESNIRHANLDLD